MIRVKSFLLLFVFNVFSYYLYTNNIIVYGEKQHLIIKDIDGKLIKKRELRKEIDKYGGFRLKNNFIIYSTVNQEIIIENITNNTIKTLKFERIFFKKTIENGKDMIGREVYYDIDFSNNKEEIVFCILPEWLYEKHDDLKSYNFDELWDISAIYLYKIKNRDFRMIYNDGWCNTPLILNDKIVFQRGMDIIIHNLKNSSNNIISNPQSGSNYYSSIELIKISNSEIIAVSYKDFSPYISKKNEGFNLRKTICYIIKIDKNGNKKIKNLSGPVLKYNFFGKAIIDIFKGDLIIKDYKKKYFYLLNINTLKEIFICSFPAKGVRFYNIKNNFKK